MNFDALKRFAGLGAPLAGKLGGPMGNNLTPPIALDLGVSGLKVLQVTPGEPPGLVAAGYVETPEELRDDAHKRLDFQLDAAIKLLKQGGFKGRRVVTTMPAGHTYCKHLQIQKADGIAMGTLVCAAVAAQVNADPTSILVRHVEVGPAPQSKGKVEVICTAAARSTVEHIMTKLRAARLEPVGMHTELSAALHAFDYLTGKDTARTPVLYLDIGDATTKIMIAHGADMVFARIAEIGGRMFDKSIAAALRTDPVTARATRLAADELIPARAAPAAAGAGLALLSAGMRQEGGVAVAEPTTGTGIDLREPLEMLVDEVRMSLRYHEAIFPGKRVERAVFLGGECRHKALSKHVAPALGLPTQLADPLARVARTGQEPLHNVDLKATQPGWTVALGLCLSPTDL